MLPYSFSIFGLVLLSAVLQQFLPIFGNWHDSRILLLPLVFLCTSVTISPAAMLMLAYLCGFMWDAQHVLMDHPGDPEVYKNKIDSLPFGYSIILYAIMGFIIQSVQPLFRQGKWQFSALLTGVAIFIYLVSEYLLINFIRGDFTFNNPTFLKIVFTSLLTMLVSPIIYWILFKLANVFDYTIRYEGLKRYRRFSID